MQQHQFLPHEINYRANIYALKKLGARQVIGVSAVGSLRQDLHPGDFVIPSQYFDWVKGNRNNTFFGEGIAAHISTAEPTCSILTGWIANKAKALGMTLHTDKTYACINGPRLGTKAESNFLRLVGCDLVGMTNIPEVFLAREAQLCYATIGIVTDFDCWMDDPAQHVTVTALISRYGENLKKVQALLLNLLDTPSPEINPAYRQTLGDALLTPMSAMSVKQRELVSVLME